MSALESDLSYDDAVALFTQRSNERRTQIEDLADRLNKMHVRIQRGTEEVLPLLEHRTARVLRGGIDQLVAACGDGVLVVNVFSDQRVDELLRAFKRYNDLRDRIRRKPENTRSRRWG